MDQSNHYNPFHYISSDRDIEILAETLIENTNSPEFRDKNLPHEKYETALLCAVVSYLFHYRPKAEQNFSMVKDLIRAAGIDEDNFPTQSKLDFLFEELRQKHPGCFSVTQYDTFRLGAGEALKSILISCAVRLQPFDLADTRLLTDTDDMELDSVADEKTAIFVIVPTKARNVNFLAGLMYSQIMARLNQYCENTAEFGYTVMDGNSKDSSVIRTFRADNEQDSVRAKEEAEAYLEQFQTAVVKRCEKMCFNQAGKTEEFWEIRTADGSRLLAFRGTEKLAKELLEKMRHGVAVPNKSRGNDGRRCPVHVMLLLEEFAETCKIHDFAAKISASPKYEISAMLFIHTLKHLKDMYEEEWGVILANCDTVVCLGGNMDAESIRWIVKMLGLVQNYAGNPQNLYSEWQVKTLPSTDCIVLMRGCAPYLGKEYNTLDHPAWKELCSLPAYAFSEQRTSYIRQQTNLKDGNPL